MTGKVLATAEELVTGELLVTGGRGSHQDTSESLTEEISVPSSQNLHIIICKVISLSKV